MTNKVPDPRIVVWEYTLRCNSLCLHCGSDAKFARKNELTTNESLDLARQISDLGFKFVVLSGGEPTLREDWILTAEKIQDEGMNLGIISNGLAWNSKTMDSLTYLDPFAIGFSVDGEEKTHDYLRGVNGSHKKIFSHIRELKNRGLTVSAITSVNKRNIDELPSIRNRLVVYGVDGWQLQVAFPMGRMAKNLDLLLDKQDYSKFANFIAETRDNTPCMNVRAGDCIGYFGELSERIRGGKWTGCGAGIYGIGIDSDGTVRGCLSLQTPLAVEGNIRESSLKDIWLSKEKFKYTRQFDRSLLGRDCQECSYGGECGGGCQSQSVAFFGEFHNSPYCLFRDDK